MSGDVLIFCKMFPVHREDKDTGILEEINCHEETVRFFNLSNTDSNRTMTPEYLI